MSPRASGSPSNLFSPATLAILLAIAIVSFGAVMVLVGWAPDLRDKNTAGAHPYSTAATGYNGFVRYLEALNYPVEIARQERRMRDRDQAVLVLTPAPSSNYEKLKELKDTGAVLIVLSKWVAIPDFLDKTRQRHSYLAEPESIEDIAQLIDTSAKIVRIPSSTRLQSPFGEVQASPDISLQVIHSDVLVPVIHRNEDILLGQMPGTQIYVLSDPDLMNSFGLAREENALLATQIIDHLRYTPDTPVMLDATLHGFALSDNPLKMMFDVPFIGATLVALASALLLGWSAAVRFGPPMREGRAIALGKEALTDNTAGLMRMTRRERFILPDYLALMRRRAARDVNAPKHLNDSDLSHLFAKLGAESETGKTYDQIEPDLSKPAIGLDDLLQKARLLYRWRRDILRRPPNER